jgi:hypothetical protein
MLKEAKCQWLTPVILAAWEGEIKKMAVWKVQEDPISTNSWGQSVIPSYMGGWDQEDHGSRPAWTKRETLSPK